MGKKAKPRSSAPRAAKKSAATAKAQSSRKAHLLKAGARPRQFAGLHEEDAAVESARARAAAKVASAARQKGRGKATSADRIQRQLAHHQNLGVDKRTAEEKQAALESTVAGVALDPGRAAAEGFERPAAEAAGGAKASQRRERKREVVSNMFGLLEEGSDSDGEETEGAAARAKKPFFDFKPAALSVLADDEDL
jgi:hypothetical protein